MEALKERDQVENWNDDRLDELAQEVKGGFAKVDQDMKTGFARVDREMKTGFARVDREMKDGFAKVDARFKESDQQFSAIRERLARIEAKLEGFARLERLVLGFGSALLIAVIGPHFF